MRGLLASTLLVRMLRICEIAVLILILIWSGGFEGWRCLPRLVVGGS